MVDSRGARCKKPYNIGPAPEGNRKNQQRRRPDKSHTAGENPLLPDSVPAAIIKADDRGNAHGIADIQGVEQKLGINNNGDRRHPVLSLQAHHGAVEEIGGDSRGQLAYHFGGAVKAALPQHRERPMGNSWPGEAQSRPLPAEEDQPRRRRYQIPQSRAQRSASNAQPAGDDEEIVQKDIRCPRHNRQPEAQSRFPRRYEEVGEQGLQKIGGHEPKQHRQIVPAIGKEPVAGPQGVDDFCQPKLAAAENYEPQPRPGDNQQGEGLPGRLVFAAAHFAGNQRIASGGQHGPKPHRDVQQRADDVNGGEAVRIHKPGHENRIHNGIKPHEKHHDHGGQGKPQERARPPLPVQSIIFGILLHIIPHGRSSCCAGIISRWVG